MDVCHPAAAGVLLAVVLTGCTGETSSGGGSGAGTREHPSVADIPGPTLDGPEVIHYPLGPYRFVSPRKVLHQGERTSEGTCVYSSSGTMAPGDPEHQGIQVAEDPTTCQQVFVEGEPAD